MLSIQLRDYQEDMIARLRAALLEHRRILLQAPTGAGKTALASFIAEGSARRGKLVYFICHRAELVRGTSRTFAKYGIAHRFIASGWEREGDPLANVVICSVDTLKNRIHTIAQPDVVLWDECHHLAAEGWRGIMEAWLRALHIGLSATPHRLDGTGLDDLFDDMVLGPTTSWLIDRGHLARFNVYAPFVPNLKGIRRTGKDFNAKDLAARMDTPKRTGDIIKHWRLHAEGMRTIGFAINRADSEIIVARFNEAGIPAAHLDGTTHKRIRERTIQEYADGVVRVLFNVALFDEGFDLASIAQRDDVTVDCLIDAAPTLSLSRVLQRWGRVLRPAPFEKVILDHAGNTMKHGFPDDEREWSLQGRDKCSGGANDDAPPPPVTCEGCFRQIKRPLPPCCPTCGKSFAKIQKEIEAEGELKKLSAADIAEIRSRRKAEELAAQTLPELVALARRRGYQFPQQWALKKFTTSKTRQRAARREAETV